MGIGRFYTQVWRNGIIGKRLKIEADDQVI